MQTAIKLHPVSTQQIATPDGTRAEIEGDTLRVRASDGALLFEYDAATGRGAVCMAKHMRFETEGDIEMVAAGTISLKARQAEMHFGSLIEHVGNAYRYVKELNQLKAGRMRALIAGAIQWKGDRVSVLAREDVHIDGKRINLG
jgi:hypothetical protein